MAYNPVDLWAESGMKHFHRPTAIEALAESLFYGRRPDAKFMVLTAYLDESYGDKNQPLTIAGFVASAIAWGQFCDDFKTLLEDNGVQRFHAKKFRKRNGEFKGWPDGKYGLFNGKFLELINKHLDSGFIVYLDLNEYHSIYAAPGLPKKARKDTPYGLCMRAFIYQVIVHYENRHEELPVNFVLEHGHKHSGDAERVFHEVKEGQGRGVLGAFSLETKNTCVPLAVPDSLAHFGFRVLAGSVSSVVPNLIPTGISTPVVHVSKPFMSRREISSELLIEFRTAVLRRYYNKTTSRRPSATQL